MCLTIITLRPCTSHGEHIVSQTVPSPFAWENLYSFLLRLKVQSGAGRWVSAKALALNLMAQVDQKTINYWLYLDKKCF